MSPWLPRASCTPDCLRLGAAPAAPHVVVLARVLLLVALLPTLPVLAVPGMRRGWCRLVLRALGVRITVSGGPIRNLRGVLVVSGHISWADAFVIGAVLPGSFVAKAELLGWPAVGALARWLRVIPIERADLRGLPAVVEAVAARLSAGRTVVAFPEGTTWCGLGCGQFRPAMFQAAVDAARPVQPLGLSYHHRDGGTSTAPAYIGDDTLAVSLRRMLTARSTVARLHVAPLQLPGDDRRALAARCEAAVRGDLRRTRRNAHVVAA